MFARRHSEIGSALFSVPDAMFLNYIVRAFTIVFGVTAPKPEDERRYGWIILIAFLAIAACSVGLVTALARLMLR
jgi:hypothetical protein